MPFGVQELMSMLGGMEGRGDTGGKGPSMGLQALASIMGQTAGAIAPGSLGARLGGIGTGLAQANILSAEQGSQLDMLTQFLGGLTVDQFNTPGLTVDPKTGALNVTGTTAAPDTQKTAQPAAQPSQLPAPVRDVSLEGGGTVTNSPFLERVRGR